MALARSPKFLRRSDEQTDPARGRGGMGGGAIDIFNEKVIEVILGASGNAKAAVEAYLQGSLKSTGSVCHEHQYHDECRE